MSLSGCAWLFNAPSYAGALSWSEENLIVVAGGSTVVILSPGSFEGTRQLITLPSDHTPMQLNVNVQPCQLDMDLDYSMSCLKELKFRKKGKKYLPKVRCLDWSPSGCCEESGGCLLSVVYEDGQMLIYAPKNENGFQTWIEIQNCSRDIHTFLRDNNWKVDFSDAPLKYQKSTLVEPQQSYQTRSRVSDQNNCFHDRKQPVLERVQSLEELKPIKTCQDFDSDSDSFQQDMSSRQEIDCGDGFTFSFTNSEQTGIPTTQLQVPVESYTTLNTKNQQSRKSPISIATWKASQHNSNQKCKNSLLKQSMRIRGGGGSPSPRPSACGTKQQQYLNGCSTPKRKRCCNQADGNLGFQRKKLRRSPRKHSDPKSDRELAQQNSWKYFKLWMKFLSQLQPDSPQVVSSRNYKDLIEKLHEEVWDIIGVGENDIDWPAFRIECDKYVQWEPEFNARMKQLFGAQVLAQLDNCISGNKVEEEEKYVVSPGSVSKYDFLPVNKKKIDSFQNQVLNTFLQRFVDLRSALPEEQIQNYSEKCLQLQGPDLALCVRICSEIYHVFESQMKRRGVTYEWIRDQGEKFVLHGFRKQMERQICSFDSSNSLERNLTNCFEKSVQEQSIIETQQEQISFNNDERRISLYEINQEEPTNFSEFQEREQFIESDCNKGGANNKGVSDDCFLCSAQRQEFQSNGDQVNDNGEQQQVRTESETSLSLSAFVRNDTPNNVLEQSLPSGDNAVHFDITSDNIMTENHRSREQQEYKRTETLAGQEEDYQITRQSNALREKRTRLDELEYEPKNEVISDSQSKCTPITKCSSNKPGKRQRTCRRTSAQTSPTQQQIIRTRRGNKQVIRKKRRQLANINAESKLGLKPLKSEIAVSQSLQKKRRKAAKQMLTNKPNHVQDLRISYPPKICRSYYPTSYTFNSAVVGGPKSTEYGSRMNSLKIVFVSWSKRCEQRKDEEYQPMCFLAAGAHSGVVFILAKYQNQQKLSVVCARTCHQNGISALKWAEGRLLVTSSIDGSIKLWKLQWQQQVVNGEEGTKYSLVSLALIESVQRIRIAALDVSLHENGSGCGDFCVVFCYEVKKEIVIWRCQLNQYDWSIVEGSTSKVHSQSIDIFIGSFTGICLSPLSHGPIIACDNQGKIHAFKNPTGDLYPQPPVPLPIRSCKINLRQFQQRPCLGVTFSPCGLFVIVARGNISLERAHYRSVKVLQEGALEVLRVYGNDAVVPLKDIIPQICDELLLNKKFFNWGVWDFVQMLRGGTELLNVDQKCEEQFNKQFGEWEKWVLDKLEEQISLQSSLEQNIQQQQQLQRITLLSQQLYKQDVPDMHVQPVFKEKQSQRKNCLDSEIKTIAKLRLYDRQLTLIQCHLYQLLRATLSTKSESLIQDANLGYLCSWVNRHQDCLDSNLYKITEEVVAHFRLDLNAKSSGQICEDLSFEIREDSERGGEGEAYHQPSSEDMVKDAISVKLLVRDKSGVEKIICTSRCPATFTPLISDASNVCEGCGTSYATLIYKCIFCGIQLR
eukprot:TRINITY_DN12371_c0_g1_i3.p1 TRINITY_DN12371_c0_g1~~TRINITY_DN12371_c0_g1_i3.p1  ORF type:complete len:1517 (-),score=159.37 TRINITY_DN12371_c0_g1_i3:1088-5638(-)